MSRVLVVGSLNMDLVVATDGLPVPSAVECIDAVAAVKEGKLAATVQQKPDLIGKMGVDAAAQLIAGRQIQKSIPVRLSLITQ